MKLKLSSVILLGLGLTRLQAQEGMSATGGNALGSGGKVSYTIGQMVYTTNTGTNGTVAQGVQQPFEISVVTKLDEAKGINLMVSAYPNPATDFLILHVDPSTALINHSLSYQFYDMKGILMETKKLDGTQTHIAMRNLLPATYFLKVIEGNREVATFKIIKN